MVIDHRNKTLEKMEVIQNEWMAKGLVKIAPLHQYVEDRAFITCKRLGYRAILAPCIVFAKWKGAVGWSFPITDIGFFNAGAGGGGEQQKQ